MNLDELVESIKKSDAGLKMQLKNIIENWKTDNSSLEDLSYIIAKWHGNVWFSDSNLSNLFYQNWIQFQNDEINLIESMTLNERLYSFSLIDIWDKSDQELKKIIKRKLKAE